jgi:hypothetical protein
MSETISKIINRAEQKLHTGENHFPARGFLATIALALGNDTDRAASNDAIILMLRRNQAEGEIYAIREDYGSGETDSIDYVRVTARQGLPTETQRHIGNVVVRASTDELAD